MAALDVAHRLLPQRSVRRPFPRTQAASFSAAGSSARRLPLTRGCFWWRCVVRRGEGRSSCYIMLSYRLNPQLRRRPGSLLFWRSVCSGGFSVVVIVNDIRYAINDNFPTAECLCNVTVRKTPLFAPLVYKNEHFTKTGSGQA